jgi:hypothetical protein
LDHLSSYQLSEWEAFDKLDPIGSWREDFRMSFIAAVLTNLTIAVNGKKGAKLSVPLDFMPEWDSDGKGELKRQTPEEMKEILQAIATTHNKLVAKNTAFPKLKPTKGI